MWLYAVTDLCYLHCVLEKAIHIFLKAGWDLARLKECSISIDVSVIPREVWQCWALTSCNMTSSGRLILRLRQTVPMRSREAREMAGIVVFRILWVLRRKQGIRVQLSAHSGSSNSYLLQRWSITWNAVKDLADLEDKDRVTVVQMSSPTSNQYLKRCLFWNLTRLGAWLELIVPCMYIFYWPYRWGEYSIST